MPRGVPHNWSLNELELIASENVPENKTISDLCREIGVSYANWYSVKKRIRDAGGPEALFELMQKSKQHRFNRTGGGAVRKLPDTLTSATTRIYAIRVGRAGREGSSDQFTVTIPPIVARPFIERFGSDFVWVPVEDGLLIKPLSSLPKPVIPDWLKEE